MSSRRYSQASRGYTLVELLITIAIVGLLTGILVTNVTRSLSGNKLSDDVTLMQSKMEFVKLLSASTQQASVNNNFTADPDSAYYALVIPTGSNQTSYKIVRLSSDLNAGSCSIAQALTSTSCLVEQDQLNSGNTLTNLTSSAIFIAFKTPVKELTSFTQVGANWQPANVTNFTSPAFRLTFGARTATVSINNLTGQLTAAYN